jgi:hypothetical protein
MLPTILHRQQPRTEPLEKGAELRGLLPIGIRVGVSGPFMRNKEDLGRPVPFGDEPLPPQSPVRLQLSVARPITVDESADWHHKHRIMLGLVLEGLGLTTLACAVVTLLAKLRLPL